MSIADRIIRKMREHNLNQADLIRATGAGRATVSGWVNGTNKPSAKHLDSLVDALKTTSKWLLHGEGISHSIDELSSNKNFFDLKTDSFSNVSIVNTPLRPVPLLDYVQAGLFHEVGYDGLNPLGTSWTTYESARPECVFSLKVEGMSMSPEFMPGDELIVDGSLEAKPGSLVIAQEVQHSTARTTFKKYRVIGVNEFGVDIIELVPLNPDFPTLNSTQIEISVIGVVVAHNRLFKY